MIDAWGGWSLFQTLLQVLNKVARKHGVSISTVAVKVILDQVKKVLRLSFWRTYFQQTEEEVAWAVGPTLGGFTKFPSPNLSTGE